MNNISLSISSFAWATLWNRLCPGHCDIKFRNSHEEISPETDPSPLIPCKTPKKRMVPLLKPGISGVVQGLWVLTNKLLWASIQRSLRANLRPKLDQTHGGTGGGKAGRLLDWVGWWWIVAGSACNKQCSDWGNIGQHPTDLVDFVYHYDSHNICWLIVQSYSSFLKTVYYTNENAYGTVCGSISVEGVVTPFLSRCLKFWVVGIL